MYIIINVSKIEFFVFFVFAKSCKELESHKTKHMKELLVNREWYGDSVLFVDAGRVHRDTHTLAKATGNLPLISTLATRALGVYQILKHDKLVLSKDAALKLNERLSRTQLAQQK